MSTCVYDVASWISSNRLKLNTACAVVRDQPTATPDLTGTHMCWHRLHTDCYINTRPGYISGLLSFHEAHASRTVSSCFNVLTTQIDPLHPPICHTHGSPVTCCVFSIVSTRLRQRSTCRLACPQTEQNSVSPECWCVTHPLGKQVRSCFIATMRPSLVAGAAANRLQDCRSRVSVSALTCSGVPVCWSAEHQGPAVETVTTVMVVGHVSYPYVEPVHCRRPGGPDCRCPSVEHPGARRSVIWPSVLFHASTQDWTFLTQLSWSNHIAM